MVGERVFDAWPDVWIPVELGVDVGIVQGLAARAAARQGLPPAVAQLVQRVAADMATHLMTHQGAGRIMARPAVWEDRHGVELLLSTDGTTPVEVDLRDAVLTPDLFEVYTAPGKGTVMLAQIWSGPRTGRDDRRFLVGSMSDPVEGESVSGDAWAVEERGARVVALVSDGLGHGDQAAEASAAAVSAFRAHHREPVMAIAAHLHDALRRTRGAAIALAEVDEDAGELAFCGIGNVAARLLLADGAHELVGRYGIAGYQARQVRSDTRPWPSDAMLVMHTDGLSHRWDASGYPHLRLQHPQLAASTVMRDAVRVHDDALVIALRGTAHFARSQHSEAG